MREGSIRGLRAFCAAARHLSFKAAAEELCVTPSAVSHQVKALEERLHGALFERRARALALTHLGAELRAEVEPLLNELYNVAARFEQRLGHRRALRVSVTPFFASELLVQHLSEFAERHRTIDLCVETTEVGTPPPAGCDASIVLLPAPPPAMVFRPLFALTLAPACSPQFAAQRPVVEPRALLDAPLIVHNRRPHAWLDWFARMSVPVGRPLKAMHFDSSFAVARAAERSLGVALLPVALSGSWFASGALIRPCPGELATSDRYYFVHRPAVDGNPDVAALRDWVTTLFAGDASSR
ncbi:MAG TPA: LysR substrate-binding domain-containing protein [Gammaproteobacteria bacterium]|nr:LysR substrate-binding domain-containing protein [Gammaproteobacteria bacterium]